MLLPQITADDEETPYWVHLGGGNIFRPDGWEEPPAAVPVAEPPVNPPNANSHGPEVPPPA